MNYKHKINFSFHLLEKAGLLIVLLATIYAIFFNLYDMVKHNHFSTGSIFTLFMLVEVIKMVEIYYKNGSLPVIVPIFISIVGVARHVMTEPDGSTLIVDAVAILILTLSAGIHNFFQNKFLSKSNFIDENCSNDKKS